MSTTPFMTVVTRVCQRPRMLAKNIASVRVQSDKDVEQIFMVDRRRRGRLWANRELYNQRARVDGEYVYILDDDCRLIEPLFVSRVRHTVEQTQRPAVVMVRSSRPQVKPVVLPKDEVWGNSKLLTGKGANCLCYVVRRDWYRCAISAFGEGVSGAGRFLNRLLRDGAPMAWCRFIVAETMQLGRDLDRSFERGVRSGWWEKFARKHHIIDYGDGDWRIRHWL